MSGGQDDGIENLQGFCALLETTCGGLEEKNDALEARGDGLDDLEERAGQVVVGFSEALEEAESGFAAAHHEATAAVEALAESAQEGADASLASVEDRLASAQGDFDQRRGAARADLDQGFVQRVAGGFEALAATVDDLEERAGSLQQENEADAQALSGGLVGLEGQAAQEGADTSATLGQGVLGLQTDGGELMRDALLATEGWSAELAELKRGVSEAGADLSDLYDAWGTEAEAEGDAAIRAVTDAGQETADFIGTDGAMQLEASLRGALAEPLPGLAAGLGQAEAVLKEGESVARELEGLVPQLEICLRVVEEISRLLEEMGG